MTNFLFVDLMVTTVCDRQCPSCCCQDIVQKQKPRHFSIDSIVTEIEALASVSVVILTGGEPTLHPEFTALVAAARQARGTRPLYLATNGIHLVKYASVLSAFEVIRLSLFDDPSNEDVLDAFQKVCPLCVKLQAQKIYHRQKALGDQPCNRQYRTTSVMDGLIYPCCVACGISNAESTPLTPGWEERLLGIRPPCGSCIFGEKRPEPETK